jgi:hypothetical protein
MINWHQNTGTVASQFVNLPYVLFARAHIYIYMQGTQSDQSSTKWMSMERLMMPRMLFSLFRASAQVVNPSALGRVGAAHDA